MKQLFGAACAMVIALGGLAMAPAQAQQQVYRDHEGWTGAGSMQLAAAPAAKPAAQPAAKPAAKPVAKKPAAKRWVAPRHRWTPAARRWTAASGRPGYRQVWFGNKVVWWPASNIAAAPRPHYAPRGTWHRGTWHYASWRTPYARRYNSGRRVYWHPGYWSTDTRPGTVTPEPVYRYNPNGTNPGVMNAPPAAKPAAHSRSNARQYPGYQYYYYGKPVNSAVPKPSQVASRPGAPRARTNAATAPKDNIPTVYLYQRGHQTGIHLPPATPPTPEPTAAPGAAPGAPGAPAPGSLIPGAAPAPGAAPGAAPAPGAVPPAPLPPPARP